MVISEIRVWQDVLRKGVDLGNPNYKNDPDPNCKYCHGLGFKPCNIDGFDTCLDCNIEGDHRITGAELRRMAEANGVDIDELQRTLSEPNLNDRLSNYQRKEVCNMDEDNGQPTTAPEGEGQPEGVEPTNPTPATPEGGEGGESSAE